MDVCPSLGSQAEQVSAAVSVVITQMCGPLSDSCPVEMRAEKGSDLPKARQSITGELGTKSRSVRPQICT